jgi:hypothetical protein
MFKIIPTVHLHFFNKCRLGCHWYRPTLTHVQQILTLCFSMEIETKKAMQCKCKCKCSCTRQVDNYDPSYAGAYAPCSMGTIQLHLWPRFYTREGRARPANYICNVLINVTVHFNDLWIKPFTWEWIWISELLINMFFSQTINWLS